MGLIDEWATRFFQELDYEREARNAAVFRDQMASLGGITVAEVYENLTSREVLTTAWVQGGVSLLAESVHMQLSWCKELDTCRFESNLRVAQWWSGGRNIADVLKPLAENSLFLSSIFLAVCQKRGCQSGYPAAFMCIW